MFLERLEDLHRVKRRDVEAGDPHIHDDGNLEVRTDFLELIGQVFPVIVIS